MLLFVMVCVLGKPVDVTWTRLAQTARVSDKTLHLQTAVPWSAGDYVAIASTGDHHSQNENEKRQIDTVSEDGLSITLTGNCVLNKNCKSVDCLRFFSVRSFFIVSLLDIISF